MSQKKIRVGITHGDFNGVGYEVILKALADDQILELMTPVIFGSSDIAAQVIKSLNIEGVYFTPVKSATDAHDGRINIVDVCSKSPNVTPGRASEEAGEAALAALEKACEAIKSGSIDVLVTAPIDKNSIQSERFHFPGHTEYLEEKFCEDGKRALMVLFDDYMKVALVTTHLPISKVSEACTRARIYDSIKALNDTLRVDFGIDRPMIGVLGLNPHCGDRGMIGTEEYSDILPAIDDAVEEGLLTFGPFAADGFFGTGKYLDFDGVLAMYHDQGLPPFKALASNTGVNFTAGLTVVRTSPDHGTAYDIAGKGIADPSSMRNAMYAAIDIYRNRKLEAEISANPLEIEQPEHHQKPQK